MILLCGPAPPDRQVLRGSDIVTSDRALICPRAARRRQRTQARRLAGVHSTFNIQPQPRPRLRPLLCAPRGARTDAASTDRHRTSVNGGVSERAAQRGEAVQRQRRRCRAHERRRDWCWHTDTRYPIREARSAGTLSCAQPATSARRGAQAPQYVSIALNDGASTEARVHLRFPVRACVRALDQRPAGCCAGGIALLPCNSCRQKFDRANSDDECPCTYSSARVLSLCSASTL